MGTVRNGHCLLEREVKVSWVCKREDTKVKTSLILPEKIYQNRKISLTCLSSYKLELTGESIGSYISLQPVTLANNHGGNVLFFSTVSHNFSLAESEMSIYVSYRKMCQDRSSPAKYFCRNTVVPNIFSQLFVASHFVNLAV